MKILIHSNAPWAPTGYGRQTKLLAPRLKAAGHDVAISAFYGLSGAPITWEGMTVFPAGQAEYGVDVLPYHAQNHGADLVITLMDFWKLAPIADQLREFKTLAWLPVDCSPLGRPDLSALQRSGAQPVAMSLFGEEQLEAEGFAPFYAPHAVDTAVYRPPADRKALRTELGVDDFFLIGICAANSDALRKAWPEQFEAFRRFAEDHDDARLMVHSVARSRNGFPLDQLASDLDIADKIIFSDQYAQVAGLMDDAMMADWFGCLDLLSACSYAEGFGLPLLEAKACGTRTVATNGSAMSQLAGRTVLGLPYWNPVHRAWWDRPDPAWIRKAYERAYTTPAPPREQAARAALPFAADYVFDNHWTSILKTMEES